MYGLGIRDSLGFWVLGLEVLSTYIRVIRDTCPNHTSNSYYIETLLRTKP